MQTIYFLTATNEFSYDGIVFDTASAPTTTRHADSVVFNPNNGLPVKTISPAIDTVYIDGILKAPGYFTPLTLISQIKTVFPKSNSGSVGSGSVEGLDLYLYSHSYGVLQSPANVSPNRLYQKLVFSRLRFGSLTTRANSGYFAQDVAGVMMNGGGIFTPGTTGVVMLDCIQNDLRVGTVSGVMAAANLAGFKNSLRAMLWYLRCSSVLQSTDASFVYTGTWTTISATWFMGGSMQQTIVVGATVTITVTGTDFVLFTRATGGAQASATVTVDGVTKATITNPGSQCVTSTSTLAATSAPVAIPLTGLGAGAHTIVITNNGGGGNTLFVDAIGTISSDAATSISAQTSVLAGCGIYVLGKWCQQRLSRCY
jgi:hypothetical protein